jgi:hypothetical protein
MFAAGEIERLDDCLERLVPYFDANAVALTGGVAVEYYLAAFGRPGIRERLTDLDFVACSIDGIARGIARDFLVSHYHRACPGVPKALLQLVDPIARLRIDIFPDRNGVIARANRAAVGATSLLILGGNSILEHKLQTIRMASAASPADPKHWVDARALAEIDGWAVPALSLHLAPAIYCTDVEERCSRCELSRSPDCPLAPKTEILRILGYV